MSKPRPYVVPAKIINVEPGAHHVRLTVDPEQGPTAMWPVIVYVNRAEFPEWANVKVGTRVRVGIVMEGESDASHQ